jgi:hypothetical protein
LAAAWPLATGDVVELVMGAGFSAVQILENPENPFTLLFFCQKTA